MGWTKQQIIAKALSDIGIADYKFDLQPEQIQESLNTLDLMMAYYEGKGVRLGYAMSFGPLSSNLASESGLPIWAIEAVCSNLSLRLSPSLGKKMAATVLTTATEGTRMLISKSVFPSPVQLPSGVPMGAGNKWWRTGVPFSTDPGDTVDPSAGDTLDFT